MLLPVSRTRLKISIRGSGMKTGGRGAKDKRESKRKHFVAVKYVRETASYLNEEMDPFKGSCVPLRCALALQQARLLKNAGAKG